MKKTIRIPKSRRVAENQLQVTMIPQGTTPATNGQPVPGQITTNVDASNPIDAVKSAVQSMPPGKPLDRLMISQPGAPPGTPSGTTTTPTPAKPLTPPPMPAMESVEALARSLKYPYSIVLPRLFETVLRKVVGRSGPDTGMVLREVRGRVWLAVHTPAAMAAVLSRLTKLRESQAKIILEGIKPTR